MSASEYRISRCGLCRFYTHQGRRGGICSQLNAPVSSQWKACRLAVSPFEIAVRSLSEEVAGIAAWQTSCAQEVGRQAEIADIRHGAKVSVFKPQKLPIL